MTSSEVRYVNSGGVHIAYRVFGDGPLDLILVPAFTSHLEQNHEWPGLASWNKRLASYSRLIVFDNRGTGLSDHAPGPVVLEETMQDVLAVLYATGAERPAVYGDLGWAGWTGLIASLLYLTSQGDILATAIPGFPVWDLGGLLGSTLWGLWVIALGVAVLRAPTRRPAVDPITATAPATPRTIG